MDFVETPSAGSEVTLSRSKAFRRPLEDAESNSQPRTNERGKQNRHAYLFLHEHASAFGKRVLSSPQSLSPALRVPTFGIREWWFSGRSASASSKVAKPETKIQADLSTSSIPRSTHPDNKSVVVHLKCPDFTKVSLFTLLQNVRAGGPIANVSISNGVLALQFAGQHASHTFRKICAEKRFVVGQTVIELAEVSSQPSGAEAIVCRTRNGSARRVLRLYTAAYVPRGVRQIYHTNLDISKLQRIMGQIVQEPLAVVPMFQQHHIVFAVHFTSIAAAVQVHAAFTQQLDLLSCFSCWKCQFEHDPAERLPIA